MNKLEIRKSQALHNYATGAIADFPEVSLMICSPDIYSQAWGSKKTKHGRNEVHDDRIAELFDVDFFVQPPEPSSSYDTRIGIQAVRFPGTMFCPFCKTIHYLVELMKEDDYYIDRSGGRNYHYDELNKGYFCPSCYESSTDQRKTKLTPSRFIIANEHGLVDDFPWDWFCHREKSLRQNRRKNGVDSCYSKKHGRHLKLEFGGGRASLSDMSIECKECGAKEDLGGIFDQEDTFMREGDYYLSYTNNYMSAPWKGYSDKEGTLYFGEKIKFIDFSEIDDFDEEDFKRLKRIIPRTLQRGAGNVHFPISHRTISLPRESYNIEVTQDDKEKFKIVLGYFSNHPDYEGMDEEGMVKAILDKEDPEIEEIFGNVLNGDRKLDTVKKYLRDKLSDEELVEKEEKIRRTEYNCFLQFDDKNAKPEDWYKSSVLGSDKYDGLNFIDNVVLLHKLKQLNVLRGFTRIKPLALSELIFADDESDLSSRPNLQQEYNRIQDIRKYSDNEWLPATTVRGEGVFITLDNSLLNQWIQNKPEVKERARKIKRNYITNLSKFNSDFFQSDFDFITPKYVLLHTLAHILIDQIAQYSGYNAASLSEIIYSTREGSNHSDNMNGILIYTSSSDAEGTLGGLVNHGKPGKLENLFRKGLEKAKWCSSDPLCIENDKGQGFMGVNLAACHSCCMLPESCCENMNRFLDRALLVGTISEPDLGLFSFLDFS